MAESNSYLGRADSDLLYAQCGMQVGKAYGDYTGVASLCSQAAEKYFKHKSRLLNGNSFFLALVTKVLMNITTSVIIMSSKEEKRMGTIKTSEDRYKYIKHVLDRDNIPYHTQAENREIIINLPESTDLDIEIIQEDADCEIQRSKTMHHAPVFSLRTIRNKKKLERLLELEHRNSFQVLDKDSAEFEKMY